MPADKYTDSKIIRTIKDVIARWEPRIVITSTPIERPDDMTIVITINYDIPELNKSDSFQYRFNQ